MNPKTWEDWAIRTLQRSSLSEPPDHVLKRAYAIGARRKVVPAWLAAAAMLTVAVTAGVLLTQRDTPSLPPLPVDTTVRSGEVTLLEPIGAVEEVPAALSWELVEGATSYRVRILAVDDRVLYEETAESATIALPPETTATLHAAVTYLWQVDALDANGAVVARSQPARFEIRP